MYVRITEVGSKPLVIRKRMWTVIQMRLTKASLDETFHKFHKYDRPGE